MNYGKYLGKMIHYIILLFIFAQKLKLEQIK